MPIVIAPNINGALFGQAAYASGQGMGQLDALRLLARSGRYGGGGQPQQQDYHMGSMPQTGVGQVSDALANGELGGDNGLAQDTAIRQGDTGTSSTYDPALGDHDPRNPNWTPPSNSVWNADGTPNDNMYGGAEGDAAAQQGRQQQLDDDSMQREASYRQRVSMIQNDDSLSDASKQSGLRQLAVKHAQELTAQPYNYLPNTQQQFDSRLVQHPDGSSYVQQPDGSFTPHAPPDPNPIDPTNPATMQPTVSADPTEPPKSQFQQHFEESMVKNPATGEMGTWDGKKFTPFEKPTKEAATEKDETRAQFVKEYNATKKALTKTDADGNVTEPTKDQISQHMKDVRDAFEEFHGRKAYGNKPETAPKPSADEQTLAPANTHEVSVAHQAAQMAQGYGMTRDQARDFVAQAIRNYRVQGN